ncbi:hypothetical protein FOL47_003546 [Perkinsus chesapeaki]|uniref:Uncharacterized protein n=1 Tax=Perkinsus chesapeaki TaxID=330153 RepID=A0A7J6MZS7_PERCH|nr:hypothetical protein FOL47_003546 [Perkinsus chesapeaki]
MSSIASDATGFLEAKVEALTMRVTNLESLYLPKLPTGALPSPMVLLSTMNRSLSECLELIEKTECELRDEINRVQNELASLLNSKTKESHLAVSDVLARTDSLEVARSEDANRLERVIKEMNSIKRHARQETQFLNKTESLGKQINDLRDQTDKLGDEVKSLSKKCTETDVRSCENHVLLTKVQERARVYEKAASREELFRLAAASTKSGQSINDKVESIRTALSALEASLAPRLTSFEARIEKLENVPVEPLSMKSFPDSYDQAVPTVPGVASLQKISLEVKNIARGGRDRAPHA